MRILTSKVFWLMVAMLASASYFLSHQQGELQRLRAESDSFRRELTEARANNAEVEKLRRENAGLSTRMVDPLELARLRAESDELRRLKTDIARQRESKPVTPPPAKPEPLPEPRPPLTANVRTTLPSDFTLVTGGWRLSDGRLAYAFVTPTMTPRTDGTTEVLVEARFVTMDADAVTNVGLAFFSQTRTGAVGSLSGLFDPEQSGLLFKALNKTPGVDVLAAPRVTTLAGRQTDVSLIGNNPDQPESGIRFTFLPNLSADGQGLDLGVMVSLPDTIQKQPR